MLDLKANMKLFKKWALGEDILSRVYRKRIKLDYLVQIIL